MTLDTWFAHHESGHFRYIDTWMTSRDDPRDSLLIWVLGGTVDVTVDETKVVAAPGDVVLLEPGHRQSYAARPGGRWEWMWIHYGGKAAREIEERLRGPDDQLVRQLGDDHSIRARFSELVTSAAIPRGRQGSGVAVDACAYSLLGLVIDRLESPTALRTARTTHDLSYLTTWIIDHLDHPLGLTDLAAETGWSTAQLSRNMSAEFGLSPMAYVSLLRVRRAERLLADSRLSVTQVARMVGFDDPQHFSRRFRQLTGRPPSHVRSEEPA